jgi:DNA-binding LytR/AlgR family response regulator
MPSLSGIKLAEKMRNDNFLGEIVFLTTSNGFASQAYHVKAFDYMLKPPTQERVNEVINTLRKLQANEDRDGLFIKSQGVASIIPFREISYVEADKHSIGIIQVDNSVLRVYSSWLEMTKQILLDRRFLQCHRSFVVNLNEIKTMTNNEIIMRTGKVIPVSKGYSQVRDKIIKWMFKETIMKRGIQS